MIREGGAFSQMPRLIRYSCLSVWQTVGQSHGVRNRNLFPIYVGVDRTLKAAQA